MKLTPPKAITFWIAIILGVLALLGVIGPLYYFSCIIRCLVRFGRARPACVRLDR